MRLASGWLIAAAALLVTLRPAGAAGPAAARWLVSLEEGGSTAPGVAPAAPPAVPRQAGSLGLRLAQVLDEDQPSFRGPLAVLEVWPEGPAAAAGIEKGDLIVAVDGAAVGGKDAAAAFFAPLHGPAGGHVHLTVLRPEDGLRRLDVEVARVAPAVRQNPSFEPFGYRVSRAWRLESYGFPLPWSPRLPFAGIEDVLFVPDFADHAAAGYHALVWVWWLDGQPVMGAGEVRAALEEYFRGLSVERGSNHHFKPDLETVRAKLEAAPSAVASVAAQGATVAGAELYRGEVVTYNPEGQWITLQVDVEALRCPSAGGADLRGHTALLFRLATRPRQEAIWRELRQVTGSFRCERNP